MILIVIVLLEVLQLILLWRLRKGGTFVNVTQKYLYVPAASKKKKRSVPRIEEVDEDDEY